MSKRYAVSIEICHLLSSEEAKWLAEKIRHRLADIDEDIYLCISEYEQVVVRKAERIASRLHEQQERLPV